MKPDETAKPIPEEPDLAAMRAHGPPKLAVVGGAIDIEEMRLKPRTLEVPSAQVIVEIPVRKPGPHTFFRVNPSPAYQFRVNGFNLKVEDQKDQKEFYIVANDMAHVFDETDIFDCTLYVTVTRTGTLTVWPIRDKDPITGDWNAWHRAAATVAEMAMQQWLRAVPDKGSSSYKPELPKGVFPEPQWPPDLTMADILRIAFIDRGRYIRDNEHPVIRRLQGRL